MRSVRRLHGSRHAARRHAAELSNGQLSDEQRTAHLRYLAGGAPKQFGVMGRVAWSGARDRRTSYPVIILSLLLPIAVITWAMLRN